MQGAVMTKEEFDRLTAANLHKMLEDKQALSKQIGGDHYKACAIQPIEFIEANGLGFLEGCAIKRLVRHNRPGGKGRHDIEKAIHELQLILELRYSKGED